MQSKEYRYKVFILSLFAICMLCTFLPESANAADYYVDADSGDDANTGLLNTDAWETLHYATGAIPAGSHTIHLLAGTYDVTHEGNSPLSITQDGITIEGVSPISVIIDGYTPVSATWTTGIDISSSNVTIRNLTLQNFENNGILISGGSNNTVEGCTISDNIYGIIISSASNISIKECTIYNNPIGISVSNCSPEISNNVLYDNTTGMYLNNTGVTTYSPVVINNLIYRGDSNPMDTAISVNATGSTGCILNPTIYHNTLFGGNQDGIYLNNMAEGVNAVIKYNIIAGFGQYGINNYLSMASADIDYNNTYNNTSGDFSTGLSGGASDIHTDASFADANNNDYHITIDSPCVDVIPSAENTVAEDLDGYSRPQGDDKDMGCYEFLPEPVTDTNQSPSSPTALSPPDFAIFPTGTTTVTLRASTFSDPDGDTHSATTWLVKREDKGIYFASDYDASFYHTATSGSGLTTHTVSGLNPGMQYVWKVGYTDASGNTSWSTEYRFRIGTINTHYKDVPSGSQVADYRMFSVPKWVDEPLCTALFGHLPVEKYNIGLIRVGTYNPATGRYIECGPELKIKPGQSYWLLVRKGIKLAATGIPVSTDLDIELKLQYNTTTENGWNMIASPNAAAYIWGEVLVIVTDAQSGETIFGPISISELTDDTYIDRRIWAWSDGSYVSYNNSSSFEIESTYGYWVKANAEQVTLNFQAAAQEPVATVQDSLSGLFDGFAEKGKTWLKKAMAYPKAAIAFDTKDTPPMPMGIENEEIIEDKCFISTLGVR